MFFSQQHVSTRFSLEPEIPVVALETSTPPVDIGLIYENDLFNTYQKTYSAPVQPTYVESPLPQPPFPVMPEKLITPSKKFLPQLKIKLKGIIALDDQSLNTVIISDEQTREQKSYKIGDTIEDALLIKIFSNKAIFVRSNGQMETLYLNENEIDEDIIVTQQKKYWVSIVKKIQENSYILDHKALAKCVKNLGVFFDVLDITSVYEKDMMQGFKVGNISTQSLGHYLGLESGDIITHILDIPVDSLHRQKECYQKVCAKKFQENINITLKRKNSDVTITYKLEDLKDPFDTSLNSPVPIKDKPKKLSDEDLQQERIALLKRKYKFAPTAQDLKIQQKLISLDSKYLPPHLKKKESL